MLTKFQIKLKLHKSTKVPFFRIYADDQLLIDKQDADHQEILNLQADGLGDGVHKLIIEHYGKTDLDTVCDAEGKIVADRAIELLSISIDGFEVPKNELFKQKFYPIWPPHFQDCPAYLTDNNWLGFNGRWILEFNQPFAKDYYGAFWLNEEMNNIRLHDSTVDDKDEYFEVYGFKLKLNDRENCTLSDLRKLIDEHEEKG